MRRLGAALASLVPLTVHGGMFAHVSAIQDANPGTAQPGSIISVVLTKILTEPVLSCLLTSNKRLSKVKP
jgi:hypothetical protein